LFLLVCHSITVQELLKRFRNNEISLDIIHDKWRRMYYLRLNESRHYISQSIIDKLRNENVTLRISQLAESLIKDIPEGDLVVDEHSPQAIILSDLSNDTLIVQGNGVRAFVVHYGKRYHIKHEMIAEKKLTVTRWSDRQIIDTPIQGIVEDDRYSRSCQTRQSSDQNRVTSQKVLILQSETRDLSSANSLMRHASIPTISAVMNYHYAKKHGYDYLYFQFDLSQFANHSLAFYGMKAVEEDNNMAHKSRKSCLHPSLKQFRASPWCKLLACWDALLSSKTNEYSHIIYIDSDAYFNPICSHRSLEKAIRDWNSIDINLVVRRPAAGITFFDNFPYEETVPCSGFFVMDLSYHNIGDMIKEWWDANLSYKNFHHAYEQVALHDLLRGKSKSLYINFSSISLQHEKQFHYSVSNWVRHIGSTEMPENNRHLLFKRVISTSINSSTFAEYLAEIRERHSTYKDPIPIAESIMKGKWN